VSKKRTFNTLSDFLQNLHKEGATLIDFNGNKVPCICVNSKRYDDIMSSVYGKKLAVNTLLNIFYDGYDVFVDVQMEFLDIDIVEYYLLHANNMLEFFEALASTGLISIIPNGSLGKSSSELFMIQLPKKEAAENALQIIKANTHDKDKY
jgi:hypothetical protein